MNKIYKTLIYSIFVINSFANAAENQQYVCYGGSIIYVSQPYGPATPSFQPISFAVAASNFEEAQIKANQIASSQGLWLLGSFECRLVE